MENQIKVRKLSRPAPACPGATLIAHRVITLPDGSIDVSGAWFGTDRAELVARVSAYINAQMRIA